MNSRQMDQTISSSEQKRAIDLI